MLLEPDLGIRHAEGRHRKAAPCSLGDAGARGMLAINNFQSILHWKSGRSQGYTRGVSNGLRKVPEVGGDSREVAGAG